MGMGIIIRLIGYVLMGAAVGSAALLTLWGVIAWILVMIFNKNI